MPKSVPASESSSITLHSLASFARAARSGMPKELWDYLEGGAGRERTLSWNESVFETVQFLPRVLQGVDNRSCATAFLGQTITAPLAVAPIGSLGLFSDHGAEASARACSLLEIPCFVGIYSSPSFEVVREVTHGPLYAQLYLRGDESWLTDLIQKLEAFGYDGICLTLDSPVYGKRERDLENDLDLSAAWDSPNLPDMSVGEDVVAREKYQASMTWNDVERVRQASELPLVLKGIVRPDDAVRAIDAGADAVYVSNHGGRQLDGVPATLGLLPSIAEAVDGRVDVVVDGGFRSGSDVLAGLALGADLVAIGRPSVWGAAVSGTAGVKAVLDVFVSEILDGLALLGAKRVDEVDGELIVVKTTTVGG
jgi:(S)-3,5-dihydroxyphenylglycine transaminase